LPRNICGKYRIIYFLACNINKEDITSDYRRYTALKGSLYLYLPKLLGG